jgi:hypothetical protein
VRSQIDPGELVVAVGLSGRGGIGNVKGCVWVEQIFKEARA